ncbi:MAG TPA: hypothetical protein VK550_16920 [Polyangiaceae bacterium]|jgi:hypothetical protein|nr:hypothetical protein [Polyangiaceae bacterium]
MIGILLTLLFGITLMAIVRVADRKNGLSMLGIIAWGYVLRLILQNFIRDIEFFNHAAGGDCQGYEQTGVEIARLWRFIGVTFMTNNELPGLGPTVLPQNMFAGIIYLNAGDPTRLGCTALVAFAAGITCFNLYHLALQHGADPVTARWTMTLFYLGPTYLHYTSDMFKDGLVACFTVGALASGIRLMKRVSLLHTGIGIICLWGLWYVRFYLIFITVAPLVVGLLGMRSKSIVRPLFGSLALAILGLIAFALTDAGEQVTTTAMNTYEVGVSESALGGNAKGGSGVKFDDGGSPYGQLWLKVLYTLFAPFVWASGSFGFHVGKIDVLIICFFVLRAWSASRIKDLRLVFLMVMTFVVPCTVAYATSMANVGLIARQRLVVIVVFAFLASFYRPAPRRAPAETEVSRRRLRLVADLTRSRA